MVSLGKKRQKMKSNLVLFSDRYRLSIFLYIGPGKGKQRFGMFGSGVNAGFSFHPSAADLTPSSNTYTYTPLFKVKARKFPILETGFDFVVFVVIQILWAGRMFSGRKIQQSLGDCLKKLLLLLLIVWCFFFTISSGFYV